MQILRGADHRPMPTRLSVATVGKFVVVHRGHRVLLGRVLEEAERLDAAPAVVTFDRHPLETIAPEKAPKCLLATLDQRLEMFEEVGAEIVLVLEFTHEVQSWEPEEFVDRVIVRGLNARRVVVGQDFRFGHRHRGDVALLRELGGRHRFDVESLELVHANGREVSSSEIRRLVLAGLVDEAAELMGRPYRVAGEVVEGARRGRDLGYPTANLRPYAKACLPLYGVYAGYWRWRGRRLPGAINVGITPTFPDVREPKVEIHVFDLDQDLYGEQGEIEFTKRLREERRFESVAALVEQMRADVATARKLLVP